MASVRAAPAPETLDIWSWGANDFGKLGSVPPNPTIPWPITVRKPWIHVAGGNGHSLALTADGEVWAWGSNLHGELGDGTNSPSLLPKKVPGLSGITMIAAGNVHSVAYRSADGVLFAWGSNSVGQLAQPDTIASSNVPVQIAVPGVIRAIGAGGAHTSVLTDDGLVYAWGGNSHGQLGLGDFQDRRSPELVPLPQKVRAIAGGGSHTIAALEPDGAVYSWGWNVFGQLGRGYDGLPTDGEAVPAPAVGVTDVTDVSAGDLHNLAKTSDGQVWVWGYNTEGQLGNGPKDPTTDHKSTPFVLTTIEHVAKVDAGGIFSLALADDGTVWAWGDCRFGTCGVNQRVDAREPVLVPLHGTVIDLVAAGSHALVIAAPRSPSVLTVAGMDLEVEPPPPRPTVRDVVLPADVADISSGFHHTLVLDADHQVWAFGRNDHGQLGTSGNGATDPAIVALPLDGAVGFSQVNARADQSFALRSDGALFAWGDATYGQLGIGSSNGTNSPTLVNVGEPVLRVAAGERHTLVLGLSGAVYAFGQNLHGELGTPPTDKLTLVPALVPRVQNPVMIAAGGYHSLAVSGPGELTAWGSAFRGQLGSTLTDTYRPVLANFELRDVMTVSAGRFHTIVTRAGGLLSAFGDNTECQVGSTPASTWLTPTDVPFTALYAVAGDYHSVAVGSGGEVVAWGNDGSAQLGRDDTSLPHADCEVSPLGVSGAYVAASGATHTVVAHAASPRILDAGAGSGDR